MPAVAGSPASPRGRRLVDRSGLPLLSDTRGVLRRDLEGVRALAVVGVVVYHLHNSWLPGGFAGVDAFFVLGRYFITGLLVREIERTARLNLLAFWGRRVRRLLPAAAAVVSISTVLAGARFSDSLDAVRFAEDGKYTAVFGLNWHLAAQGTNYLADPDPSPLTHFWSLGVEEQFYALWPVALALVVAADWLGRGRWPLLALILVLILASYAVALHQTEGLQPYAYFATYSRVWQLGVGALLSVGEPFVARLPIHVGGTARCAGVALILVFYWLAPAGIAYPGWYVGAVSAGVSCGGVWWAWARARLIRSIWSC